MFISVLDFFKISIGPSSSHTAGPMSAAFSFREKISLSKKIFPKESCIRCTLKGSLAYTGKGHRTDKAIILGLNGFTPDRAAFQNINQLINQYETAETIEIYPFKPFLFQASQDIIFDKTEPLKEHPNGMIFEVLDRNKNVILSEIYFSIGGGFISTKDEMSVAAFSSLSENYASCPYSFDTADAMLIMAKDRGITIAQMKKENELVFKSLAELNSSLDSIWQSMEISVNQGLATKGILPGGLNIARRAENLYKQLLLDPEEATTNDWLCAYAMAVSEENAAGHMIVTAPTNGAAGVIPSILYYMVHHHHISTEQIRTFLLTAGAIGGLIKYKGSISGAEVGCQGEIGSASAMAAAGLCAIKGGKPEQIENAAEIALEHHLGMTCDPVKGLVQVPCIERNGFGAIKAFTASSLALKGSGHHFMSLDNCIAAMKQTGLEMSVKFKETSLGGLAVNNSEC